VFAQDDLADLPQSARAAVEAAVTRLERAAAADDVEQVIGTAKELVETVAKVVINALGGIYGSGADLPKLASDTLKALNLHPIALGGRPSLRKFGAALASTVNALAELRNTDGTGHGRATPSDLDASHATLAREAALAWSRWVLSATHRALQDRVPIAQMASDIAGPRTFSRGELPELLRELRINLRGEDDQLKLGLAVARRWSVNGTFLPRTDVIEPMASGDAEYPSAFAEGVVEGLLLDHDGYLRIHPRDLQLVVAIGDRLPADRRARVFEALADRARDALLSYAFMDEAQVEAIRELRRLGGDGQGTPREALLAVADRIEGLRDAARPEDA
jgi:hypothetical protein